MGMDSEIFGGYFITLTNKYLLRIVPTFFSFLYIKIYLKKSFSFKGEILV